MKTIGFVDRYISEWHANHYPDWIRQANETLGTDYTVGYAWAEVDVSPVTGETTDEWCEKMGVKRCDSLAELCEKSDVIMVLAPSDPDTHLAYARAVLPYGKRTYIDKTFAPDYQTAQQIFALGEKTGTPFFSTSALRYAKELDTFTGADHLIVAGGGRNFNEYMIHLVEMAVKVLNDPARRVKVEIMGKQRLCRVETQNGKEALLLFSTAGGYSINGELPSGKYEQVAVNSDFFPNLLTEILRFYETGEAPFDPQQTLEVMRVRTALLQAEKTPDVWVEL